MAKKSKTYSKYVSRISIFGSPPLLEGEDSAAYDELLARVSGDLKPTDMVEEIWIRDVVDLTWETLRLRRMKAAYLSTQVMVELRKILKKYARFLPSETEQTPDAPNPNTSAKTEPPITEDNIEEKWAAKDPTALAIVRTLMSADNCSMDNLMATALLSVFDHVERIDRLATIAEGRRNSVLREIGRHRSTFAQAMRERVQQVEDAEFKVIEPKPVTDSSNPNKAVA